MVRWPKLDQLSMIVGPGASRGAIARWTLPFVVDCADVDEMGEQGAGRIELLAVRRRRRRRRARHRRFEGADMLALGLGEGVAEAIALQHRGEPEALLLLATPSR